MEQAIVSQTPVTPEATAQLALCLNKIVAAYQMGQLVGLVLTLVTPKEDGTPEHYDINGMLFGQAEGLQAAIEETNARYTTVTASAALVNAPTTETLQ